MWEAPHSGRRVERQIGADVPQSGQKKEVLVLQMRHHFWVVLNLLPSLSRSEPNETCLLCAGRRSKLDAAFSLSMAAGVLR